MNEKEYQKRKDAHDRLERDLVKHGTRPEDAKKIATRTAHETDKKQGKG